MINLKKIILLLCTVIVVSWAFAQEQQEQQANSDQTDSQSNIEQTADGEAKPKQNETQARVESVLPPVTTDKDTFIPSEEISKDLSVSFPVDI